MNGKDAEALPWMAKFQRDPWPGKVVWHQDDVVHRRFYWLQIPEETPIAERAKLVATVEAQTVSVNGEVPGELCLRLSDRLLDLDAPVTVRVNGREAFSGEVPRRISPLLVSLTERADPTAAAPGLLRVKVGR
jgi:hypothetical protein